MGLGLDGPGFKSQLLCCVTFGCSSPSRASVSPHGNNRSYLRVVRKLTTRGQGREPEDLSSNPGSATDVLCDLSQVTPRPTLSPAVHELGSSFIHVVTHPPTLLGTYFLPALDSPYPAGAPHPMGEAHKGTESDTQCDRDRGPRGDLQVIGEAEE